jgi:hypothetical protein
MASQNGFAMMGSTEMLGPEYKWFAEMVGPGVAMGVKVNQCKSAKTGLGRA